ncbi:Prefoldin subunit 2 [Geodia barretti]|uniref:Prefoldin subunit 2 n=1 Tax=Geodia barretti TaxID=519541 RepID=A0AA35SP10_GEOBA|nr:Prefoldin subunit 2 [Geodia barretti]
MRNSPPKMAEKEEKEKAKGGKKGEPMTQEKIVSTFQKLRQEQRAIVGKITELEGEHNEYKLVVDVLKGVEGERRCFRLVGGVLVERTVKEVLPALQYNNEQISIIVTKLHEQLEVKGRELSEFKEKYGIRFQGEEERDKDSKPSPDSKAQGVLVS